MATFLASFLVFLGAACALALGRIRNRPPTGRCGGCAARDSGGDGCGTRVRALREVR